MKLIIAGGRDFDDSAKMIQALECFDHDEGYIEIVCGGAKGADSLGKAYAEARGFRIKNFPADWKKHNKAAGPIRNKQMGDYADALVAFWDGKSRGTKHMIEYMESLNKPVFIVRY